MDVILTDKCFNDFLAIIHELTGITIAKNRTSMVEGRLRKRVTALKLHTYEDYLRLVRVDKSEQTQFIELVTTNETYFFRTPRIWELVENKFLPAWFAKHPKQVFSAWSAAASSGEEAHSLGVLCQAFKEKNPAFNYQIVGTDISQEMIGLCQQGRYSGRSIEAFRKNKPQLFDKYMRNIQGEIYQINSDIKNRLQFRQHNLFKPLQFKDKFDLVLIRNVLIYFNGPDQEKVLSLIAPHLPEDGALIIGESESLSHIATPYKPIEPLVYRIDSVEALKVKAA